LFSLGFSRDEVAQIRGLTVREIAGHLTIAREHDMQVNVDWLSEPAGQTRQPSLPAVER
jgi:hypothetical protein